MLHYSPSQAVRSKSIFKSWLTGEMGELCMLELLTSVVDYDLLAWKSVPTSMLPSLFQLIVWELADFYYRFCAANQSSKHVFKMMDLALQEFLKVVHQLRGERQKCERCLEQTFLTVVLDFLGTTDHNYNAPGSPEQHAFHQSVQKLLHDHAVRAPLASDIVECKNSQIQAQLHRFKGKSTLARRCSEASFVKSVVAWFSSLVEAVKPYFLPSNYRSILAMVGNKLAKPGVQAKPLKERQTAAAQRKFRKLSGFLPVESIYLTEP